MKARKLYESTSTSGWGGCEIWSTKSGNLRYETWSIYQGQTVGSYYFRSTELFNPQTDWKAMCNEHLTLAQLFSATVAEEMDIASDYGYKRSKIIKTNLRKVQ